MSVNLISVGSVGRLTNPTVDSCFPSVEAGASRLVISLKDIGLIANQVFTIRAVFRATGGATASNVSVSMLLDSGANTDLTTFAGDTVIGAAATALSIQSVTRSIFMYMDLIWDNHGNVLSGSYRHQLDTTLNTDILISANPAITSVSNLRFAPRALFSASDAAQTIILTEFSIDQD